MHGSYCESKPGRGPYAFTIKKPVTSPWLHTYTQPLPWVHKDIRHTINLQKRSPGGAIFEDFLESFITYHSMHYPSDGGKGNYGRNFIVQLKYEGVDAPEPKVPFCRVAEGRERKVGVV